MLCAVSGQFQGVQSQVWAIGVVPAEPLFFIKQPASCAFSYSKDMRASAPALEIIPYQWAGELGGEAFIAIACEVAGLLRNFHLFISELGNG